MLSPDDNYLDCSPFGEDTTFLSVPKTGDGYVVVCMVSLYYILHGLLCCYTIYSVVCCILILYIVYITFITSNYFYCEHSFKYFSLFLVLFVLVCKSPEMLMYQGFTPLFHLCYDLPKSHKVVRDLFRYISQVQYVLLY